MYIKYKLYNIKQRHIASINKDVLEAKAEDFNGKIYDKVSLWTTDWNNLSKVDGTEILAEIKVTEKNGYKNITLYPEKTEGFNGFKKGGNNISKLMDKKAENIEVAQNRKNESIAFFNATNSALSLLVALPTKPSSFEETQKFLISSRDWFLSEWQKYESSDITNKHQAF